MESVEDELKYIPPVVLCSQLSSATSRFKFPDLSSGRTAFNQHLNAYCRALERLYEVRTIE